MLGSHITRIVRPIPLWLLGLLSIVAMAGGGQAQAQGGESAARMVMPPPRPHPVIQRDLTLTALRVEVQIKGSTATTRIRQTLRNDNGFMAEGEFLLPLPEGASISDFALIDGDNRLNPEMMEAGKARQIYQDIVRTMRDPGLLEFQDSRTVKVRAFPFNAGQSRDIEFSFNQTLGGTTDLLQYQLPLRWANWSRNNGASFVLSYEIDSSHDLGGINSPTYGVSVNRNGDRRASGSYEATLTSFTDFTLNIGRRTGEFAAGLMCFPAQGGEDGYFLLSLLAAMPQTGPAVPKDVVFIVDKSGSMSGEKIEQARGALTFCLGQLNTADRFNVVTYSDAVDKLFDGLRPASGSDMATARQRVEGLTADGGTDINSALATGAGLLKPDGRPAYVIFLTDGLPTVGETDANNIINNAKAAFAKDVKVFVFGVGYDVNTTLLDSVSYNHKGSATYVGPTDNVETKVSQFYSKIASPALTGIKLDIGGLDEYELMPRELPDLFHNNELFITGRYRGTPPATVTVSVAGTSGSDKKTFAASIPSGVGSNHHQVPRLWATRKVSWLLDQLRLRGDNAELLAEVDRLATRFGIVTPYTSYLITEPGMYFEGDARRAQLSAEVQTARDEESGQMAVGRSSMNQSNQAYDKAAAPQSAGATAGGGGGMDAPVMAMPAAPPAPMQRERGSAEGGQTVNYVQNQTFVRMDDGSDTDGNARYRWVDARQGESKPQSVRVQTYSDEYFALLSEFPQLADFLSQGEAVTVVVDKNLVLETTPDEAQTSTADLDRVRTALRTGSYLSGESAGNASSSSSASASSGGVQPPSLRIAWLGGAGALLASVLVAGKLLARA